VSAPGRNLSRSDAPVSGPAASCGWTVLKGWLLSEVPAGVSKWLDPTHIAVRKRTAAPGIRTITKGDGSAFALVDWLRLLDLAFDESVEPSTRTRTPAASFGTPST